jgi:hypothetical protein
MFGYHRRHGNLPVVVFPDEPHNIMTVSLAAINPTIWFSDSGPAFPGEVRAGKTVATFWID